MINRNNRGVTLIMVAAVLAILAALATGFFVLMLMQTKSATRFADSVRAEMIAQAGIHYSIAKLRYDAFTKTETPSNAWYQVDYLHGATRGISFPDSDLLHNGVDDDGDGEIDNAEEALLYRSDPAKPLPKSFSCAIGNSAYGKESTDRFTLNISDAASKININAGENIGVMLDNLCRVIGPPLVAANLDALQPRRWGIEMDAGDPIYPQFATSMNKNDLPDKLDIYYVLTDKTGTVAPDGRPMRDATGVAIYGDGYAIAGWRARHGSYRSLEEIKNALTYVERNGNSAPDDPLEQLEIEVKFAAIRDYITISSWVDTNTVCVGKFEWIHYDSAKGKTYAIDRDKSWVNDDPVNDPLNVRGSLRGCYLSIINGHGAGQLRRIRTNGIDWVEVEGGFTVTPGPISSYMIISNEEALMVDDNGNDVSFNYQDNIPPVGKSYFPKTKTDGTLVPSPKMDYSLRPLCIHRAPVNVNTASDKVLVAMMLGINVQHGHPLSIGTDTDVEELRRKWKTADPHGVQPYVLTPAGLKRLPASSGKPILNRQWDTANPTKQVLKPPVPYDFAYLNNYGTLGVPNYFPQQLVAGKWNATTGTMTEAHELAYRIMMARQLDPAQPTMKFIDPLTGAPTATDTGLLRGPFRVLDDLYFRVIKPWDDMRFANGWIDKNSDTYQDSKDEYHNAHLSRLLMAAFNTNTDILKFNPNIEWIDRWGRNYTEQEPVMVFTDPGAPGGQPLPADGIYRVDVPAADTVTYSSIPLYTSVPDPDARGWGGQCPPIRSSQRNAAGNAIEGAYITRSFRYKSDELIDKTDLNRSTTEFTFDSNGIVEIISTGQVIKGPDLLAERKFTALVKIYDVWRESLQSQFVQGTISDAFQWDGSSADPSSDPRRKAWSGQLSRDASGNVRRKGLVTLPEPLLPLRTRILDHLGKVNPLNAEAVTAVATGNSDPLDAYGKPRKNPYDAGARPIDIPDVLANHILPARYDGQIALATNTLGYDPTDAGDKDCFLASFDGDLDTATCQGNGREQAKWPYSATADSGGNYTYTGEGYKHRCVHTVGLLGLLNDTLIATDPGLPLVKQNFTDPYKEFKDWTDKKSVRWIYPFFGIACALQPLKLGSDPERPAYWNNVTLRQGDLRTDGAYLSGPGVAGNNATLKYLFTPDTGNRAKLLNFQPNSETGNDISMWMKPTWHQDDMRNHEFFNPGNPHIARHCAGYFFQKLGQYKWTSVDESGGLDICGNRRELNDLFALVGHGNNGWWDQWIMGTFLHGGYCGINANTSPNESPSYRTQPFRWSYVGFRANYGSPADDQEGIGPRGHCSSTDDWRNQKNITIARSWVRPFIDTALYPENETNWPADPAPEPPGAHLTWAYRTFPITSVGGGDRNARNGWADFSTNSGRTGGTTGWSRDLRGGGSSVGTPGPILDNSTAEGQDAKYVWADPYGKIAPDPTGIQPDYSVKCFGMNNLNFGNPIYNEDFDPKKSYSPEGAMGSTSLFWHWHNMPEDGTYAVIDEFKISNKDRVMVDPGKAPNWNDDRVVREMQTSRYYLPPRPGTRLSPDQGGPPTFTSQTMLQSLKGFDKLKDTQSVVVVRVNWDVFTPRFMCEYMKTDKANRPKFARDENLSWFTGAGAGQSKQSFGFKGPFDYVKYNDPADTTNYSVNRPPPWAYLDGAGKPTPANPTGAPIQSGRGVEIELLKDDGAGNISLLDNKTFTDPTAINRLGAPDKPVWVYASQLRYRVRFCYPVDPLVDPYSTAVNALNHPCVDPSLQYMLDTPVFDDISITYIISPRILAFRELSE